MDLWWRVFQPYSVTVLPFQGSVDVFTQRKEMGQDQVSERIFYLLLLLTLSLFNTNIFGPEYKED